MPGVVSQHEIQPVQRVSIHEVQNNAGRALYLPCERRAHLSHHPTSSRLHTAESKAVIPATHGTTDGSFGSNPSTASLRYLQPTIGSSSRDQGLYPSQQASRGANASAGPSQSASSSITQTYSQQYYPPAHPPQEVTSQHIDPCTESWPWDDLLDSPESGSFQSASTTYDPPSVDSISNSYNSSTGSETALLTAEQLWDPLTDSSHQPLYNIAASHPRPIPPSSALPPLVPRGACPSGPPLRQLGQSTERRRVPRPRFRLSNQTPSLARRSLLAALDAAKDTRDADGGQFYVDYSFRASVLIKAQIVPLHQEDLEQWFVCRQQDGMIGYQGFADVHPSSHPVNIPDMEWQDSDPSSDVIVAMDGMPAKNASQCSRYNKYRIKSSRPHVEPGSADSMFAWLSKLLPGL
ncbi:hypothetical protein WJX77_012443 [Trebouxia sp. C0004]